MMKWSIGHILIFDEQIMKGPETRNKHSVTLTDINYHIVNFCRIYLTVFSARLPCYVVVSVSDKL